MAMLPCFKCQLMAFILTRNVRAAFLMFIQVFRVFFVPFMSLEVTLLCGERREEKINDQL